VRYSLYHRQGYRSQKLQRHGPVPAGKADLRVPSRGRRQGFLRHAAAWFSSGVGRRRVPDLIDSGFMFRDTRVACAATPALVPA